MGEKAIESRTKHSKRNIISGLIKQVTNLVLTFALRTIVIYFLGAEYQGLSGLFSSILQVLSLADLGFASAIMFILYKPIVDGDNEAICAIVNYLKKIYFIVGAVILGLGLCIMPFLQFLISGDVPSDINIYILFGIYLFNASISYMLFAYKGTLISAMQRENVVSNIYTLSFSFVKVLQIVLLIIFRNYYAFAIVIPLGSILNSVAIQIASKKIFPEIVPVGDVNPETKIVFKKQIVPVFIGKISDVARNSLDNIIISILFGLTLVAVYDNYYYIYSALYGIMGIIIHGVIASVGNSIASESVEKNYNDLLKINFLFMAITGFISVCMYCLYQPFMNIWMKGDSTLLLSEIDMSFFCLYFYCINMTYPRSMYLDGKGLFYESRYWCILESLANLGLNILLGKLMGITGIIVATVITIVVFNFIGRSEVLFKHYFKTGKLRFYTEHVFYLATTIVVALVSRTLCELVPSFGWWNLLINGGICLGITAFIYFFAYFKTENFRESKKLIKNVLRRSV